MLSLLLTMALPQAAQAAVPEPKSPIVKYCEDHKGDKIGDGECASLVVEALRAAGMSGYQNEDKPSK
ncbi:MAG TPA: hypothetical protein VG944_24275, partial [Fimbriimonas sp.]|nr:hypothetical protein [Fimbriimonas sp.]